MAQKHRFYSPAGGVGPLACASMGAPRVSCAGPAMRKKTSRPNSSLKPACCSCECCKEASRQGGRGGGASLPVSVGWDLVRCRLGMRSFDPASGSKHSRSHRRRSCCTRRTHTRCMRPPCTALRHPRHRCSQTAPPHPRHCRHCARRRCSRCGCYCRTETASTSPCQSRTHQGHQAPQRGLRS
jgi:hypothetical protein